jgi:hypothetical protein
MSCAAWRYFGSPRVVVSCCKTENGYAVTAEVAGSSPVVPAILLEGVIGRGTENSNPQVLVGRGAHSHRAQEFALRGPCFIAVFLRVAIERRLYLAVTQDSLHGFGFDLRLVHQPVA